MEASLLQTYGIDLAAEWGDIGARRLWVLILGLPSSAPIWREEEKEVQEWTRADEFAAFSIELIDIWGHRLFNALGGKWKPGQEPQPVRIDRPSKKKNGQPPAGKSTVVNRLDDPRIRAFFQRHS